MVQNKNLVIAHFTDVVDGRTNSGTARVARELINMLSTQQDITQYLIHFEKNNDSIYKLNNSYEILIPLINFPIAKHFFSFFIFWLKNIFTKKVPKFDISHWHSSRVYPFFFLVPSTKIFITLHDINSRIIKKSGTIFTWIFYWNLRISIKKINLIMGVSKNACENIVKIGRFPKSKVKCLYVSSNVNKVHPKKPLNFHLDSGFIVCVSRWQPYKNVEKIVEAYAILSKEVNDLPKLVLVGKPVGNYNKPFEQIKYFNLESKVLILKDLSDNELAYLYQNALINLVPSLYEGFGLTVLEGMQFGCPSIDHKYTSTSEISSEAGIHVDMRSAHELAHALKDVIQNNDVTGELSKFCEARSNKFTWENSCSTLISYYQDPSI